MKVTCTIEGTPDEVRALAVKSISQQLIRSLVPYISQEFKKMSTAIDGLKAKDDQENASNVALREKVTELVTNIQPLATGVTALIKLAGDLKAALELAQQAAQNQQVLSEADQAAIAAVISSADTEIAANQAVVASVQTALTQVTTLNAATSDANVVDAVSN